MENKDYKYIRESHKTQILFHRISWVSKITGTSGHGGWFNFPDFPLGDPFHAAVNTYPEIVHTLEFWTRRGN